MLNGGVFSLQQESENKTTNTSLKKEMAAVFASDVEANQIQNGSRDPSAVKLGALAASVGKLPDLPRGFRNGQSALLWTCLLDR